MRLRPIYLAIAVLLLLVLAYTGWWVSAAQQLRRTVAEMTATEEALGNSISPREPSVGGFPLRLALRLDKLEWRRPDGMALTAGGVEAWARPWNPLTIRLDIEGDARLSLPPGPSHPPAVLEAKTGEGTLLLDSEGQPKQAHLVLTDPMAEVPGITGALKASLLDLTWTLPETAPVGPGATTGRLNLLARSITLPGQVLPPLEKQIAELALQAELRGILPPNPDIAALRGWSEAGGTVELTSARLAWGKLDLRGNATLALDTNLQPIGAGSAELSGADVLVDMLVQMQALKPEKGQAVKTALGFLSQQTPDGRRAVRVPMTIQDRRFSIGPIKVGTVPEVKWD